MDYFDAMKLYGSDKPDTRFEMLINDYTDTFTNIDVPLFNGENYIAGITATDAKFYTRKKIDELTNLVKKESWESTSFH